MHKHGIASSNNYDDDISKDNNKKQLRQKEQL